MVRRVGYYEAVRQNHQEANGWIDFTCGEAITVQSANFRDRPGMVNAHIRTRSSTS